MNKNKLKKEKKNKKRITKRKDKKNYIKKGNNEKLDPTRLLEGSAKLRWGGGGGVGGRGLPISQPLWSSGKKKAHDVGGPSSIDFI
jgi:hypothetical protein